MARIEAVFKKIDSVFRWLTVLTLGGMTLLIFFQVIFRYALSMPLAWTEELSRFLFIWMTFIAGYLGVRKGSHIGVEALQNALPRIPGAILRFLANAISALFFGIIAYSTIVFWPKLMIQVSPTLGLPMSFVYLAMIFSSIFMALWYLILGVMALRRKKPNNKELEGDVPCNC